MKKHLIICCLVVLVQLPLLSQDGQTLQEQINEVLDHPAYQQGIAGYTNDATLLYKGYTAAASKAISYMLNTGWHTTAKTKGKFPRFSLLAVSSLANIPSRANTFYVDGDQLQYLQLRGDVKSKDIPTIFGSSVGDDAPVFEAKPQPSAGRPRQTIFINSGAGTNYLPILYLQGSVGVIKGTDILFRVAPPYSISTSDVTLSSNLLWGVGLLHSVSQWFYGNKADDRSSPIHIAIQLGYSQFQLNAKTKNPLTPSGINEANTLVARKDEAVTFQEYTENILNNQETSMKFSALNANIIGSIQIAILTPYISIGYSMVNTEQDVKGNYPVVLGEPGNGLPIDNTIDKYVVTWITDPVSIKDTYSNLHITLGARLKLGPIAVHAAYHNIDFSVYELGIGVDI